MTNVTCIGAGLVGSSMAALFLNAGINVTVFDEDDRRLADAEARVGDALADMRKLKPRSMHGSLALATSLQQAVGDADYVQECIIENVVAKRALLREVRRFSPNAVIASSTSTFPPSILFGGIGGEAATLVAHPLLPPHLLPVVELVPGPATDAATLDTAEALFRSVGHSVIRLQREIGGFLLNRLQYAVLGEALHLIDEGYCRAGDVDVALREGLGLRWASIGLLEQMHVNAEGGIDTSLARYQPAVEPVMRDLRPAHLWTPALLQKLRADFDQRPGAGDIQKARARRDRNIVAVRNALDQSAGLLE